LAFFLSTRLLIAYQRSNNLRLSFTQLIPQDDQDDQDDQDASKSDLRPRPPSRSIFLLGPDLSQKGKKTTRPCSFTSEAPGSPSLSLSRRTRPRTALRHFRVDSLSRARGKSTAKRFQLRETNRDSHFPLACDRGPNPNPPFFFLCLPAFAPAPILRHSLRLPRCNEAS